MDRSTRNLSIITLLVLATFLAMNHVVRRSAILDWWTVLLFLLLALGIWFYDRVSHRGIDDSEPDDSVIEPLVYNHIATIAIPETVHVDEQSIGGDVVPMSAPVASTSTQHSEVVDTAPVVTPPPSVDVPEPPPHHSPLPSVPMEEEAARAPMPSSVLDATPPPVKEVQPQPPPPAVTAPQTTTIEEKQAPTPSSPAPETHPDLAAKAPEKANVPSVPEGNTTNVPVPTSVSGTSPTPVTSEAGHGNTPSTTDKTINDPSNPKAAASTPAPANDQSAAKPAPTVEVPPKTAGELGNPKAITNEHEAKVADKHPVEVPDRTPGNSPEYPSKVDTKGQAGTEPESEVVVSETAQAEKPITTPGAKAIPADQNVTVSATEAADAAPNQNDPNLPRKADPNQPDDLKLIEGIGPKMEKALHAAGITTFAQLSGASEAQIREAIEAGGMRFAPSVPTWAEQASYAANGDLVGLEAYQKTLVSGRKAK